MRGGASCVLYRGANRNSEAVTFTWPILVKLRCLFDV